MGAKDRVVRRLVFERLSRQNYQAQAQGDKTSRLPESSRRVNCDRRLMSITTLLKDRISCRMDCCGTFETQAAFIHDLAQIKATCGTWHVLRGLTLLSETILSYAEGMVTPVEAVIPKPVCSKGQGGTSA